jgi:hypothetical protein
LLSTKRRKDNIDLLIEIDGSTGKESFRERHNIKKAPRK